MSNFDRRQLRYFVALAEELHFGKAARRMHISQPPLSQQIASLEGDLQVRLFHRTKRKVEITAAGQQFLRDARLILSDMDKAADRARAAAAGRIGILHVGVNYSAPINPHFAPLIRNFSRIHPHVQVELHENTSEKQLDGLYNRTLDFCFIWPTRDDVSKDMTVLALSRDELQLVLADDHPLSQKKNLSASDLDQQIVFLTPRQTRTSFFEAFSEACVKARSNPIIRTDINQLPFIMNMASASKGLAVVPEFFNRIKPFGTTFRACSFVPKPARAFPLSLIYRTNDISPIVHNFADAARRFTKAI